MLLIRRITQVYFVMVTISVAIEMSVPIELSVSVSAGGIAQDERAREALG